MGTDFRHGTDFHAAGCSASPPRWHCSTAKQLGLTIPDSLLLRADEVIE